MLYIDGVSINLALLRQHCTFSLSSSISGVFPNNQDHPIQFIVEDYEADPQNYIKDKSSSHRHKSWTLVANTVSKSGPARARASQSQPELASQQSQQSQPEPTRANQSQSRASVPRLSNSDKCSTSKCAIQGKTDTNLDWNANKLKTKQQNIAVDNTYPHCKNCRSLKATTIVTVERTITTVSEYTTHEWKELRVAKTARQAAREIAVCLLRIGILN